MIYRKKNIEIAAYGSGDDYANIKFIDESSNSYCLTIMASDNCLIDSMCIVGSSYDTGAGIRIVDDWTDSEYSCSNNKILNCDVSKFNIGIRVQRVGNTSTPLDSVYIQNVRVHDIYQDGMFIQGWAQINGVFIDDCQVDSVNMSYVVLGGDPGESESGGDAIQISRKVDDVKD